MNYNTIRICGGIGNQLFQYAFGRSQKESGISVKYDISWYNKPHFPPRPFRLDQFRVCDLPIRTTNGYQRIVKESKTFKNQMVDIGVYYSGYWQSPAFHTNIYPILKNELQVHESNYTQEFLQLRDKVTKTNSVSLHVRRGDYLNKTNQYVLPIRYYLTALNIMRNLKGDFKLFVFSDDIEWCKKEFKDACFIQLGDLLDLQLMGLCKHNIIANSTFSWWAAYLNENGNKAVIAPKKWVVKPDDQVIIDKQGLILDNWIKI